MSEIPEFSAKKEESGAIPAIPDATLSESTHTLKEIEQSLDGQSYFLGEVPQNFLMDPHAYLPLNSDRLIGAANAVELLVTEVNALVQHEVERIQKAQTKIASWEDRIEKNKAAVQKNLTKIKLNAAEIELDKKNREYWVSRAEEVQLDFAKADAANRTDKWAWLIKKWGLRQANGSPILEDGSSVGEQCNGEVANLVGQYRARGQDYELRLKDKEAEIPRLCQENARMENSNDTLMSYIAGAYKTEIEPVQDGVLLLKELGLKLKALGFEGSGATYGELRAWAYQFLDEFLKSNPRVSDSVVSDFRRIASIPLPPEHA